MAVSFFSPGHEEIFVLLRNSDQALAIQSAEKFFIYEHYDLSPHVVPSKTVENIVENSTCLMLILRMFSLAIRS